MTYLKKDGIEDAKAAINSYEDQISALKKQDNLLGSNLQSIIDERTECREQLAYGLVTSAKLENIKDLEKELGAMHFSQILVQSEVDLSLQKKELVEIKENEKFINIDEYIHPVAGRWVQTLSSYDKSYVKTKKMIDFYESAPHFFWVKKDSQNSKSILSKIYSVLGFTFIQKKKRYSECEAIIGDLSQAFKKYAEAKSNLVVIEQDKAEIIIDIEKLKELKERYLNLTENIASFNSTVIKKLISAVVSHLENIDLKMIKNSIRKEALIIIAKLDALDKKEKLLMDQRKSCHNEIYDRERRMSTVQSVLLSWEKSSKDQLSEDRSKWLKDNPATCYKRTNRFCNAYDTNRKAIYLYNDYNAYLNIFTAGLVLNEFDVFAKDYQVDNYVTNQIYPDVNNSNNFSSEIEEIEEIEDIELENIVDDVGVETEEREALMDEMNEMEAYETSSSFGAPDSYEGSDSYESYDSSGDSFSDDY